MLSLSRALFFTPAKVLPKYATMSGDGVFKYYTSNTNPLHPQQIKKGFDPCQGILLQVSMVAVFEKWLLEHIAQLREWV